MTNLIIVRHGHTALNDGDRFRGITDTPLSDRGLEEASLAAKAIASQWKISAVYSSSVARARMTAEAIGAPFGLKPIEDAGILDMDWGKWTGHTFDDCREHYPEDYRICFEHASAFRAPGGSSFEEVKERSMAAVEAIADRHNGESVVIVTHTVNVRLILIGFLGMSTEFFWRIRQGTCAINVLERDEGGLYYLSEINDTGHTKAMAEARSVAAGLALSGRSA
jgi:broad specificity phosphatase PhoE